MRHSGRCTSWMSSRRRARAATGWSEQAWRSRWQGLYGRCTFMCQTKQVGILQRGFSSVA